MFETVKTVNGYEIKRLAGSRGQYSVRVWEGHNGFSEYFTFRTIKEATTFCGGLPPRSAYIRQHGGQM